MDVVLKPEMQQFIDEAVKAGRFSSFQEVIETALARLMMDPPDSEPLDSEDVAAIEEAEGQFARGEYFTSDQVRQHFRDRGVELRPSRLRGAPQPG